MVQWKQIQLGTMRLWVQSLALHSGLRLWCCHALWCRLQMVSLWLWCRPAAVDPIGPSAWELPYVTGVALKKSGFPISPIPGIYALVIPSLLLKSCGDNHTYC